MRRAYQSLIQEEEEALGRYMYLINGFSVLSSFVPFGLFSGLSDLSRLVIKDIQRIQGALAQFYRAAYSVRPTIERLSHLFFQIFKAEEEIKSVENALKKLEEEKNEFLKRSSPKENADKILSVSYSKE